MPRDEARDFTSDERERNQLSAFGRLQNSGLRRGPGGRGGRATGRVGETPQGSNAAVQIEHVTLQAVAGQTIAAGGGTVLWDRIAAAPTERRGFRKAAAAIGSDGSVGAIPFDQKGAVLVTVHLPLADTYTLTPRIVKVRNDTRQEAPGREQTGDLVRGTVHFPDFDGGTDKLEVEFDGNADIDLADEVGTVQITQIVTANATSQDTGYRELVLSHGPIAYYRLGEPVGATTAVDETGHGHDGTYNGSPAGLGAAGLIAGDGNTAIDLDGADDYVTVGDDDALEFAGTAAFTVECWLEFTTISTVSAGIVSKARFDNTTEADGWTLDCAGDGAGRRIGFARWNGTTKNEVNSGGYVYAADVKHHVVATYDGTTLRLYVDGVEIDSDTTAVSIPANVAPFLIGANHQSISPSIRSFSPDVVDEVAIYGRALTADEIAAHHAKGA